MENGGNDETKRRDIDTDEDGEPWIGRRDSLKLFGVAVTSTAGIAVGGGTASAGTDGFGEHGFGNDEYGDGTGFSVSTKGTTGVDSTSATLGGELASLDGAGSADCAFEWRRIGATTWARTAEQSLSSMGSFSVEVGGLDDGVGYEYRAVGAASNGDTDTGSTHTFTTIEHSPAVTTDTPSNVTDSGATLNGSLTDLGGASAADCAFEWRPIGATSWNATKTWTRSSVGSFSAEVGGLSSGTDYEYRAVATASDGDTATGGTSSFTTTTGRSAPTVDSYSVNEAGSPNPHCEITAQWSVSDADGDLDTVSVTVTDTAGTLVDSRTTAASGGSASGTDEFKIRHANGRTFDVTVTVTDAAGGSDSRTGSVTE